MADESIQVTAGEPRWSGDGSRVFVPVLVDGERQSELELEWDGSEFAPVTAAADIESQESAPDDEGRERQATALCPYCNGTGRSTHEAMAASAGLNDWNGTYEVSTAPNAFVGIESLRVTNSVGVGDQGYTFGTQVPEVLTAAAAGLVPDVPPLSWFEMREPDGPTPLTITADGQVYGHAALWNTCHTGQPGRCTTAPRSQSGYRFFHLGGVETEEGVTVATGKITFGAGHAPLTASRAGTASHYDNSAHAGADVVARDGRHGIWVTGALRPDLPAKVVRTLRAAALSGDWRSVNGALELIGLLAVNVPGFPVPRAQAALAASATVDEDAVEALVAAGVMLPVDAPCEPCVEEELDELLALVAAADPLDELLAPVAIDNLLIDVGAASPQLAYAGPEASVPVVLDSQSAEDVRRRTRMQAARMVGNEPLAMALENAPDAVFSESGKTVNLTVNIASAE